MPETPVEAFVVEAIAAEVVVTEATDASAEQEHDAAAEQDQDHDAAAEQAPEPGVSVEEPAAAAPEPEPWHASSPEPEPVPEPEPDPASFFSPAPEPAVATTLHVPPSEGRAGEGGEWELLLGKIRDWFGSGQLQEQVDRYRSPLQLLAGLLAVLVVLRIYAALLGAIEGLPLVPGLLELAGVIWLTRFGFTRLVRSSDRQELLASLQRRWQSFRGKG